MNRTSKCIQMLVLLSNHDRMMSKDLAECLNTNQRNIREYRKELEDAGFAITSLVGKNGGYKLEGMKVLIEKA